ncbi:hypothetical protein Tco_0422200 [Tanacetum coccineum]
MPTNNWASALKLTYAPPQENSLLAQTGDMAMFMDWYCKRQGITHLTLQDLEGPAFEIVKVFHPDVIHLQFQMEECHKLLTDQVDDTILRSVFRDRYGVPMILLLFNEIHKFSDGTLQQIDEALDYRVKEFRINRTNPGMNARFWTKKDVDRSKDFMFAAIHKRPVVQDVSFGNLEIFVGGTEFREGDYLSRRDLPRDNPLVSVEVLRKTVTTSKEILRVLPLILRGIARTLRIKLVTNKARCAIPGESNLFQVVIDEPIGKPLDRTGKYGDFDGYTSDDLILKLEILSRRFFLRDITLSQDQVMMEMEIPRSSGVNSQPHAHT